jgi:hypothetical protein
MKADRNSTRKKKTRESVNFVRTIDKTAISYHNFPLIIYVWSCEQYSLDTLYFYDLHSLLSQNFLEAFVVN